MSIHPSLRSNKSLGAARNVLKRHERVRYLMTHGQWVEGRSALSLPKIKQAKVKARKAAGKEKEETSAQPPSTTPSAST